MVSPVRTYKAYKDGRLRLMITGYCACGRLLKMRRDHWSAGVNNQCRCVSLKQKYSREYKSWDNMKQRCSNPHKDHYEAYGGRGITVCDTWKQSFVTFLQDMGPKPSIKHSIDRINVNGNYEPSNCRWATQRQQNLNRR